MPPFARNAVIALAFLAGWLASSWRHDSLELVANKAAQGGALVAAEAQLKSAENLDRMLRELKLNEKIIIKENVKLVERPVYRNVCLDADGLRNANAAKNGTPVEPASGVPPG